MDAAYGMKNIIPGNTRVVDTVVGRTAEVHKLLPGFGVQVWVKERGFERENWPWAMITLRQPRYLKRYPRPFRWPREEATKQCHCKIGKMEVEDVEQNAVRCQRCKNLIGSESYPRRINRASDMLRKADRQKSRQSLHKGVSGRNPRQKSHRRVERRKKTRRTSQGRKSHRGLVIRRKRRTNAKSRNSKTRKRAVSPKVHQKVSKSATIPKVHGQVVEKAKTSKRKLNV